MNTYIFHKIGLVIISSAIVLAIFNFLNFRSLWLDEAMLALNFLNNDYLGLFEPLGNDQVAPIGYLLVEETFGLLFNNADWSFRIFPLICFISSILLIFHFSKSIFNSIEIGIISSILFALNPVLFKYSIEVKQYMTEVFVSLVIINSFLKFNNNKTRFNLLFFSAISFLSIWFSNSSVIILFSIGSYTMIQSIKQKKIKIREYSPLFIGLFSFIIYYTLFIDNHPARAYMMKFWSSNAGFPINDLLSPLFYLFYYSRIKSLIIESAFTPYLLTLFAAIIGLVANFKNLKIYFLLLLPILLHFILAYFRLYPFALRLMLYSIPLLICLISAGFFKINNYIKVIAPIFNYHLLLILFAVNLFYIGLKLPYEHEEIKEVMDYIDQKIQPEEQIYIYSTSRNALKFYLPKYSSLKRRTF